MAALLRRAGALVQAGRGQAPSRGKRAGGSGAARDKVGALLRYGPRLRADDLVVVAGARLRGEEIEAEAGRVTLMPLHAFLLDEREARP